MFTVAWKTADGTSGTTQLQGEDKWTFGRADAAETPTVSTDNALISRSALVIRDAGPSPVVFRGQRDNGVDVVVRSASGGSTAISEGTAHNLSTDENRVELVLEGQILVSAEVSFDARGSVVERQNQGN